MSEKPPQPDIIFVSPEEGIDWEACEWSSEEIVEDIHRAYEAYRFALTGVRHDRFRYTDLLSRAASELALGDFSRSDLLHLAEHVEHVASCVSSERLTKATKGPIPAKDVRALFERAWHLVESEAGTSGQ